MATISSPFRHADLQSDYGYASVILAERLRMGLADALNPLDLQAVAYMGDVGGSGSDTVRVPFADGLGFDASMTTLATETTAVPFGSFTSGNDTITVAAYLARMLGLPAEQVVHEFDSLVNMITMSWIKTFRAKVATTGATFATAVGGAGTNLSVDNLLDIVADYNETDGADPSQAVLMLHPIQLSQLRASLRSETAFQNSIADFAAVQGVRGRVYPNFLGLGIDLGVTSDVTTSGGAYQGFMYSRGGLMWASANPDRIAPAVPHVTVPEFGLIVQQGMDQNGQQVQSTEAFAYFGVAKAASNVAFGQRLISTT
jgi:hypothetical protein